MIYLTQVLDPMGDDGFDSAVAEKMEDILNDLPVVWDADADIIREWAEGDDEDDNVHAVAFRVVANHAQGTGYDGTWRDANLRQFSTIDPGNGPNYLGEITQAAWEKACA